MPVTDKKCPSNDKECYCKSQLVGTGGVAERERETERARERERKRERERERERED